MSVANVLLWSTQRRDSIITVPRASSVSVGMKFYLTGTDTPVDLQNMTAVTLEIHSEISGSVTPLEEIDCPMAGLAAAVLAEGILSTDIADTNTDYVPGNYYYRFFFEGTLGAMQPYTLMKPFIITE